MSYAMNDGRTALTPGFADPVLDSQACFRAVLDAMARPGTIHRVHAPIEPPPPLHRATAAVLLTLVDGETPLWLDPQASAAAAWIAFHCGAPTAAIDRSAFALALAPFATFDFTTFDAGSHDGPEDGATVILQVAALGEGAALLLDGPGIETTAHLTVAGLPPGLIESWGANAARFPQGVDLILCAGDQLAALPRTVRIREG